MKRLVSATLLSLLTACGGSGGGDSTQSPPPAPPPPPPEPLEPQGVWIGTLPYRSESFRTLCRLTDEAFRADIDCLLFSPAFADQGPSAYFDGDLGFLDLTDGAWSGRGDVFNSGSGGSFEIVGGSVDQEISIDFDIDGELTTFTGTPAETPNVAGSGPGVYSEAWMRGSVSFSMDPDGTITGQGGSCIINGASNDLGFFGRFVELDLTRCGGPDGLYTGFGITTLEVGIVGKTGEQIFAFGVSQGPNWQGGYAVR